MIRQRAPAADASARTPLPKTVVGILYMVAGIGLLTTMDAIAKELVSNRVHLVQILFIRSVLICAVLVMIHAPASRRSALKPTKPGWQCLRGLVGAMAPFCFFSALAYLPLTSATVVAYGSTFITTMLSAWLLRERVGPLRWGAVAIGYVGVLIAIGRPDGGTLFGYVLVLLGSATYSVLFISGKWLSATESSTSLVLFYNLGVGLVAVVFLPWVWLVPTVYEFAAILAFASLALLGQFCWTHAYTLADASLLVPFEYTSLIWVLAFDLLLWQQLPDSNLFLGAAIIIASSLFVAYRENLAARLAAQSRPQD